MTTIASWNVLANRRRVRDFLFLSDAGLLSDSKRNSSRRAAIENLLETTDVLCLQDVDESFANMIDNAGLHVTFQVHPKQTDGVAIVSGSQPSWEATKDISSNLCWVAAQYDSCLVTSVILPSGETSAPSTEMWESIAADFEVLAGSRSTPIAACVSFVETPAHNTISSLKRRGWINHLPDRPTGIIGAKAYVLDLILVHKMQCSSGAVLFPMMDAETLPVAEWNSNHLAIVAKVEVNK